MCDSDQLTLLAQRKHCKTFLLLGHVGLERPCQCFCASSLGYIAQVGFDPAEMGDKGHTAVRDTKAMPSHSCKCSFAPARWLQLHGGSPRIPKASSTASTWIGKYHHRHPPPVPPTQQLPQATPQRHLADGRGGCVMVARPQQPRSFLGTGVFTESTIDSGTSAACLCFSILTSRSWPPTSPSPQCQPLAVFPSNRCIDDQ